MNAEDPPKARAVATVSPGTKPPTLGIRGVRLHRDCDSLSGILICFMIIFSPWAFGTTQPATIFVMNLTGYALGILLSLKWFLRRFKDYHPRRWNVLPTPGLTRLTRTLAALTVVILAYCLSGALNARASWREAAANFEYYQVIAWLPQSYARENTWRTLGKFLALACFFWAVRDWLQGASGAEERALRRSEVRGQRSEVKGPTADAPTSALSPLSGRLRILLWVLCLNGALLAVESIAQRLSGTGKLLWLVEPRINKDGFAQLGPYAYRSNGAQYLNLIWPVCLGFWWTLRRELSHRGPAASRRQARRPHVLLIGALLMAVSAIISASRAGAAVACAAALVATVILLFGLRRRQRAVKIGLLIFFAVTLATAIYIGSGEIGQRFKTFGEDYESRDAIYETGRKIHQEFPWFGTGPGTLEAVFQMYRSTDEYWPAQLHNDWLETLLTFGWVGSLPIALALACALGRWFLPGGIYSNWRMTALIWLALAGCLAHARYDFPFQIYSILLLFLLLCAILSVVTHRRPSLPTASR